MLRSGVILAAVLTAVLPAGPAAADSFPAEWILMLTPLPPGVSGTAEELQRPLRHARPLVKSKAEIARRVYLISAQDLTTNDIRLLLDSPSVAYFAPNRTISIPYREPERVNTSVQDLAGDPLLDQQQALQEIRAAQAWSVSRGAGIVVAIVDTGVDLEHPDLKENLYTNELEAAGAPGVDDDQNGYIDDVHGYDFTDAPGVAGAGDYLERDPDPQDDVGHGTSVAGLAAAAADNHVGISGVAPKARLLAVRAGLRSESPLSGGLLQEDDAAAGIVYAADQGAHIINLSWGDVVDSPVVREAVVYAQSQGCLVVASSGNSGGADLFYPGAHAGVLNVGASDGDERASFSTFGPGLDLMAPGSQVLTTELGGGFGRQSGTSMASPIVAGIAALVWSAFPEWTATQVAWHLRLTTALDGRALEPKAETGYGKADAAGAVQPPSGLRPPTLHIAAPHLSQEVWRFSGEVQAASLLDWSLELEGSSRVVRGPRHTTQVRGLLQEWDSPAWASDSTGSWTAKLHTQIAGVGNVTLLQPFSYYDWVELVGPFRYEYQVGRHEGWDWVCTFETDRPGTAVLFSNNHFLREATTGRRHALRFSLPPAYNFKAAIAVAPEGKAGLELPGIGLLGVSAPPQPAPSAPAQGASHAGTPMRERHDVDGDGILEIIMELPPDENLYGQVAFHKGSLGSELTIAPYRGIPVDAADWDYDGKMELAVFEGSSWSVYERNDECRFPCNPALQGFGVPVGFARTQESVVLVVVEGSKILLQDRSGGFSTYSGEIEFSPGGFVGDLLHDDGLDEVAITDIEGRLHLFEMANGQLEPMAVRSTGIPMTNIMARVGHDPVLVTVERDPVVPAVEGDLVRAATRLLFWKWNGVEWTAPDSLAFAGVDSKTALVTRGDRLWVVRDRGVDQITVTNGTIAWTGFWRGDHKTMGAFQAVAESQPQDTGIWIGGHLNTPGRFYRVPDDKPKEGGIWVTSAQAVGEDRYALTIRPRGDCTWTSLTRSGSGGFASWTEVTHVVDTLSVGFAATYFGNGEDCVSTPVPVRVHDPTLVTAERLPNFVALEFPVPVLPAGSVEAAYDSLPSHTVPMSLDRGGRRMLVPLPGTGSVELNLERFYFESGLPVGGGGGLEVSVGGLSSGEPLIIERAHYDPEANELRLSVTGDPFCRTPQVRVQPGDIRAAGRVESEWVFDLPAKLSPGIYTAELADVCTGGVYTALTFASDPAIQVFPNPVQAGGTLTLTQVSPGTVITLADAAGREVFTQTLDGPAVVPLPADLAPGLYLFRIAASGKSSAWRRIGVIR